MEEIKVVIIVFNSGKVFILKEEDWDISSKLIDKTTLKEIIHLETDCDFDVFLKHVYKIILKMTDNTSYNIKDKNIEEFKKEIEHYFNIHKDIK